MRQKIVVASGNPGKLAELKAMLDADVQWLSLSDFNTINEVIEDGRTFAENAQKKAVSYAKQTGLWTVADDSGLCIDALSGRPGVKSARFAEQASDCKCRDRTQLDRKNITKVLKLLENVPSEKRAARFVCHLCLASPEGILCRAEGTLEGFITTEEKGENGFGYDSVFFVPQFNKTAAELTAEEKNTISHRRCAIEKLKPKLEKLLNSI